MPNKNRQKGDRVERKLVKLIQAEGWKAQRVPLSGAAGGEFSGDVVANLPLNAIDPVKSGFASRLEAKSRLGNTGYTQVLAWLVGCDYLYLDISGQPGVVVMPWEKFCELQHLLERREAGRQEKANSPGHRDNDSRPEARSTDDDSRFGRRLFDDYDPKNGYIV